MGSGSGGGEGRGSDTGFSVRPCVQAARFVLGDGIVILWQLAFSRLYAQWTCVVLVMIGLVLALDWKPERKSA